MSRPIFHLSFPVRDLARTRAFYCELLGARVGREHTAWMDLFLWGHQLTVQLRPDEVPTYPDRGRRHFGVILSWERWEDQVRELERRGVRFRSDPRVEYEGTDREQAKVWLEDPDGYAIEIKAYRNVASVFGGAAGYADEPVAPDPPRRDES